MNEIECPNCSTPAEYDNEQFVVCLYCGVIFGTEDGQEVAV